MLTSLSNIEIAAISKILVHKSSFLKFLKKRYGIKYAIFLIMKQKTRFKILEISVSASKKPYRSISN